ncbi:MAG: hypothetical protein ACRD2S_03035 [Terriglobales bacterium]
MKRSKAKPAKKRKKVLPRVKCPVDAPVEMAVVREQITRAIGKEALAMVQCTMAEVKTGHYLAMKYLFEMGGLFPAIASSEPASEESLTKLLLRKLGIREENGSQELSFQTKVTKELSSRADEATGHAVK